MQNFYDTFPSIKLKLGPDFEIEFHPEDYFYAGDTPQVYCLGIQPFEQLIFGGLFMKNWDIYFDLDGQKLGFRKSFCGDPSTRIVPQEKPASSSENTNSYIKSHNESILEN